MAAIAALCGHLQPPVLQGAVFAVEQAVQGGDRIIIAIARQNVGQAKAGKIVPAAAEQLFGGAVAIGDLAQRVTHEKRVKRAFDDGPQVEDGTFGGFGPAAKGAVLQDDDGRQTRHQRQQPKRGSGEDLQGAAQFGPARIAVLQQFLQRCDDIAAHLIGYSCDLFGKRRKCRRKGGIIAVDQRGDPVEERPLRPKRLAQGRIDRQVGQPFRLRKDAEAAVEDVEGKAKIIKRLRIGMCFDGNKDRALQFQGVHLDLGHRPGRIVGIDRGGAFQFLINAEEYIPHRGQRNDEGQRNDKLAHPHRGAGETVFLQGFVKELAHSRVWHGSGRFLAETATPGIERGGGFSL